MTTKLRALLLAAVAFSGCASGFHFSAGTSAHVSASSAQQAPRKNAIEELGHAPKAEPPGRVGDCIAEKTLRMKYITCAPVQGQWVTALSPFNPAAHYAPFVGSSADYFARYGHEINLQAANAVGKPASAANCGTPVGERYSDASAYEKFPTVCPNLPANYVITDEDRNDMKMAAYGTSTWWDTFIVPNVPVPPRSDFCNDPASTCHPACATCPTPPPCPTLPALDDVPANIREIVNAAPYWFPAGTGKRKSLNQVKAWLVRVEKTKAKTVLSAADQKTLSECKP